MKTLLIKLSGELFSQRNQDTTPNSKAVIKSVVGQIKRLSSQCRIGLVVGGGNFFRGALDRTAIGLQSTASHTIGMLSTVVNGVTLQDLLAQEGTSSVILSAFSCPEVAQPVNQNSINDAFLQRKCIIFVGGTGNPFFTTDTNAVLRALQTGAQEVWKATKVDGVYASDPIKDPKAALHKTISYREVLDKNIVIMDRTAITLAEEHTIPIRVFNLFSPDALQKALENPEFGSRIR